MFSIISAIIAGSLALFFAGVIALITLREGEGTEKVREIGRAVQDGAMTFLRREYTVLLPFVAIITVVLWLGIDFMQNDSLIPKTALSYLAGTALSGVSGFLGMNMAVRANTRTTNAATRGLNPALRIAFSSGTVMGMTVVGLGLLGVTLLYLIFQDISIVAGFGLGASSIALFARVGGGIFTKAADVGADLVGKVEAGIPEDDPRNPAVIADNVGDNVGDVAGMGADLFESYVGSIIAAIALAGATITIGLNNSLAYDADMAVLPLLVAALGIISSVLGTFFVRSSEDATFGQLLWALRKGIIASAVLVIVLSLAAVSYLDVSFNSFWAILSGLFAGIIIGFTTEFYTSYDYSPTKSVADASQTGAATNIIAGLATGMQSTMIPVIVISLAIFVSFELLGFYGVALAGVGMLSTLGITLATDAYGPVADNAGGIAEQAHLPPKVRERTDSLDALGNTTAATGKGFAIGSAALTSLALMAAYAISVGLVQIQDNEPILVLNLLNHKTLIGLLIGAMLPSIFSAMTMKAVGRAAFSIVNEVRRQFKEIPGIMEGTGKPDYERCVDISTRSALKEMINPGLMAVGVPILIGFVLGKEALGGLLFGSLSSGFLLAIMMANAGGTWDNAKKFIELGNLGGKGSDTHKAAVVGDTVGDPFKDTSGPSINILLKLMAIVSLVFAPVFESFVPLIDRLI
ncbi:MAG: sodium-translocating pyrophosphatase [Dehalococcoidia bacterium]|nr:sodium-translocating pyrophosphatase [Dehalococcoidia bacterium]|tara:strand:+ start:390 stop:2465 length:2076 start_codon:yes stop_codon:yes gene_type:complete